jgi:hypothetical protein
MTDPVHSVNIFFAVGFVTVVIITISVLLEHLDK